MLSVISQANQSVCAIMHAAEIKGQEEADCLLSGFIKNK